MELGQFLTRLWEGETSLSYQPPPGFKAGLVAHGDETDGFWEGKDGGRSRGAYGCKAWDQKRQKNRPQEGVIFRTFKRRERKNNGRFASFFPRQKSNCSQFSLGGWVFLGRKLEVI